MNARLLYVLLVLSVALAFSARFRRAGIALSAILVVLIAWVNVRSDRAVAPVVNPATPASASAANVKTLPVSAVELIDPQLTGTGAPWQVSGRARNGSNATVNQFTLRVTRFDCPNDNAAADDCTVNWQGERTVHLRLPPQAIKTFNEALWSHDPAPRIVGGVRVEFAVLAVQATTQ